MKLIFAISFLTIGLAYDDVVFNENVYQDLINNKAKLHDLYGCLVDDNPCTELAQHIKEHIIEIMKDGCAECEETQKHYAHLLSEHLKKDFPDIKKEFMQKYDKTGKEIAMFDKAVEKY